MPAKSSKQRKLMAIASHAPEKVKPENKSVLKMTKSQQHDFATTDEKGLPVKVKHEKKETKTINRSVLDKGQQKQIGELCKSGKA